MKICLRGDLKCLGAAESRRNWGIDVLLEVSLCV